MGRGKNHRVSLHVRSRATNSLVLIQPCSLPLMLLWSEPSKDPASRAELCASETSLLLTGDTHLCTDWVSLVADGKQSASSVEDLGSIPGLGRFPGEGNGYSLQFSCLENSMDRGAWWATIHGFEKSWT